MLIRHEDMPAAVLEHLRSREWYVVVTDRTSLRLVLAAEVMILDVGGRAPAVADLDVGEADFIVPEGGRTLITYMAFRKSAVPFRLMRHLLWRFGLEGEVPDGKDVFFVADGPDSEYPLRAFIACVEVGKISMQRRDGSN